MSLNRQLNNITNRLDLKLGQVAKKIMNETKARLKESVDSLWYDAYPTPTDYIRTYQLLNSVNGKVTKNCLGNYSIEVYLDPEFMTANPSLYGWGQHTGFDKSDFRRGLIQSIIHGMGGSSTNPRLGDSTNVIEVVQNEAEKYANSILKKYIK